jgi:hypothetical protein
MFEGIVEYLATARYEHNNAENAAKYDFSGWFTAIHIQYYSICFRGLRSCDRQAMHSTAGFHTILCLLYSFRG